MWSTLSSKFLLLACLVTFGTSTSIAGAQAPLAVTAVGDSNIISSYRSVFSSWTKEGFRPLFPLPEGICIFSQCFDPCSCQMGPKRNITESVRLSTPLTQVPVNHDTKQTTSISLSHTTNTEASVSITVTPAPLPFTAQTLPTRTTIYQASTASAPPSKGDTKQSVNPPSQEPTPETPPSSQSQNEITDSFYTYLLTGQNPATIALMVEDSSLTPVTILSLANTRIHSNLISSTLIEQLNLTNHIFHSSHSPSLHVKDGPETLASVLGHKPPIGQIKLNVLAGRKDRMLVGVPFAVFTPLELEGKDKGRLQNDAYVGLDFLNQAGALRLSEDYEGFAGREGLGVVVQRVFEERVEPGSRHDEL